MQETLVRAHRSIGSFEGKDFEEFRRWLTGVAAKTVLQAEEDARRHWRTATTAAPSTSRMRSTCSGLRTTRARLRVPPGRDAVVDLWADGDDVHILVGSARFVEH